MHPTAWRDDAWPWSSSYKLVPYSSNTVLKQAWNLFAIIKGKQLLLEALTGFKISKQRILQLQLEIIGCPAFNMFARVCARQNDLVSGKFILEYLVRNFWILQRELAWI